MKRIVKAARKIEKKPPAMPSTVEIASGTDAETFSAPDCTFSPAPLSPSHSRQLVGASQLLDCRWQVLKEVAHAPHQWDQEEEADDEDRDRGAEHRHRRSETA